MRYRGLYNIVQCLQYSTLGKQIAIQIIPASTPNKSIGWLFEGAKLLGAKLGATGWGQQVTSRLEIPLAAGGNRLGATW